MDGIQKDNTSGFLLLFLVPFLNLSVMSVTILNKYKSICNCWCVGKSELPSRLA